MEKYSSWNIGHCRKDKYFKINGYFAKNRKEYEKLCLDTNKSMFSY